MGYAKRHTVTVTTIADGSATAYTPVVSGRILSVTYAKTDYTDGVDFTITTETTAQNVWVDTNINASEAVLPRAATHDTVGAAALYAAAGTAVLDYVWAAQERVKIVIAQGGNVKTGTFHVVVG